MLVFFAHVVIGASLQDEKAAEFYQGLMKAHQPLSYNRDLMSFSPCSIPSGCTFESCCGQPPPLDWYNDTCLCAYNCINCHGGVPIKTKNPVYPNPEDWFHACVCPPDSGGIDCRQCVDGMCPSPQVCSHEVFFDYFKVYDCYTTSLSFLKGRFVWQVDFPVGGGAGSMEVTLYAYNATGPTIMNCSLTDCSKSYDSQGLTIQCQQTQCCTQGWAIEFALGLINAASGQSIVTIDPSGNGKMTQSHVAFPFLFQCKAYACEFPGQQVPPMPLSLKVAVSVATGVVVLSGIILALYLFLRVRKQKQYYMNLAGHRLGVTLVWESISCTIGQNAHVLVNVSGVATPGTCLAILGESGSGKTSLLDVLSGRKTVGKVSGSVLANGRTRGKDWKRISAYVMQDDVFLPFLTVRETILFAARMRLPSLMNDEEREQHTDHVIDLLGLNHIRNIRVGSSSDKTISGGEIKRLAIAVELVTNPSLIFLDEPTSGLDSANALRVVRSLHHLARRDQKTVVFTIHQPDSALFELFDNVMVLAKGRVVYSGPSSQLLSSFETEINRCPPKFNPADFVIHFVTSIENVEELNALAERNRELGGLRFDENVSLNGDEMDAIAEAAILSEKLGSYAQPWLVQFIYLTLRSLRTSWRSRLILWQFGLAIVCGLVLGGLYYNVSNLTTGVQNRTGVILFVVVLLSILSLTSIDTFISQRQLFLREKGAGFYSPSCYFASIALTDIIPLRVLPSLCMALVMYWLVGLHPGTSYFLWFSCILMLVSFCSTSLCLFLSTFVSSVAVANIWAILIILGSVLFGGLLVNVGTMPAYLAWLKWLSFVNYSFEALMINELADLVLIASIPGEPSYPVNGAFYLTILGLNPSNFYLDVFLIFIMGIVLFLCALVSLQFVVKEKR